MWIPHPMPVLMRGVSVNLSTGESSGGHATGDVLTNIENLIGSVHADTLTGDAEDNRFEGLAGADILDGGDGVDTASYTSSDEGVSVNLSTGESSGGHAAGDVFTSIENLIGSTHVDTLTGDAEDNRLEGLAGADTLDGGDGVDTASYASSDKGVVVNLSTGGSGGHAAGDVFTSIENLIGSAHADTLTGDAGDNGLEGLAGADTLDGGDGVDTAIYASSDEELVVILMAQAKVLAAMQQGMC